MINIDDFTLVPSDYKKKDPRPLLYLYQNTINIVAYAKRMQQFSYYQTLEVAEDLAKRQGFILLPWDCINWRRARDLAADRKVKIGRHAFYMLRIRELTKNERQKLEDYLLQLKEGVECG